MPDSRGNINVSLSVEEAQAVRAWRDLRAEAKLYGKMLDEIEGKASRGRRSQKTQLLDINRMLSNVGREFMGIGRSLASVQNVARLLMNELEAYRALKAESARSLTTVGEMEARGQLLLPTIPASTVTERFRKEASRAKGGVVGRYQELIEALSAAGRTGISDEQLVQMTITAANKYPLLEPSERKAILGGALKAMQVFPSALANPEAAMAQVINLWKLAPATQLEALGAHAIPGIGQMARIGPPGEVANFRVSAAHMAAFAQSIGDPRMRRAPTNLIGLVDAVYAEAKRRGAAKGTGMETLRSIAFPKTEAERETQKALLGIFDPSFEISEATPEQTRKILGILADIRRTEGIPGHRRARQSMREIVAGESAYWEKYYKPTLEAMPEMGPPAVAQAERTMKLLQGTERNKAVRAAQVVSGAVESLRVADVEGGLVGQLRNAGMVELLTRTGTFANKAEAEQYLSEIMRAPSVDEQARGIRDRLIRQRHRLRTGVYQPGATIRPFGPNLGEFPFVQREDTGKKIEALTAAITQLSEILKEDRKGKIIKVEGADAETRPARIETEDGQGPGWVGVGGDFDFGGVGGGW